MEEKVLEITQNQDTYYMGLALEEAKKAYDNFEVPVGALIVHGEDIIARAHNATEKKNNPISHAELRTISIGCATMQAKYLLNCTLYVTLEPCAMCAMACYWSQLGRLVFSTTDDKRGYHLFQPCLLHPKTKVTKGILANESKALLQKFFQQLRK